MNNLIIVVKISFSNVVSKRIPLILSQTWLTLGTTIGGYILLNINQNRIISKNLIFYLLR